MKKVMIIIACILVVAAVVIVGFVSTRKGEVINELKTIKLNEVTRSVFYAPPYTIR